MAQYTTITNTAPLWISDGVDKFGFIIDGVDLCLTQYVNSSYENIEEYVCTGSVGTWRLGVRDSHWVIDCATTSTGFSGTEGIDWTNVEKHKLKT